MLPSLDQSLWPGDDALVRQSESLILNPGMKATLLEANREWGMGCFLWKKIDYPQNDWMLENTNCRLFL